MPAARVVKFGVIAKAKTLSQWQSDCLNNILSAYDASMTLYVCFSPDGNPQSLTAELAKQPSENLQYILDFSGQAHMCDLGRYTGTPLWQFLGIANADKSIIELFFVERGPAGSRVIKSGACKWHRHVPERTITEIGITLSLWTSTISESQVLRSDVTGEPLPERQLQTLTELLVTVESSRPGLASLARKAVDILFSVDRWNIGLVDKSLQEIANHGIADSDVTWMPATDGINCADPFGVVSTDGEVILYESFRSGKAAQLHASQQIDRRGSRIAIGAEGHISYPFTIEVDGSWYCCPETHELNRLNLYKLQEFPYKWILAGVLLEDIPAVDATIIFYDATWWLFYSRQDTQPDVNLFIAYSSTLTGPYTAHPQNPVKSDIRSSRSAGTPFELNGCLYRPAQDCSETYGGKVVLNRIVKLTKSVYQEEIALTIPPVMPYKDGIHTLASFGKRTLIDGKRRSVKVTEFPRLLSTYLRKFVSR